LSSGDQGLKTKQELLDEYEKGYLDRLEKKDEPEEKQPEVEEQIEEPKIDNLQGFQDLTLQFTTKAKKHEKKDYIGRCIVCKKGVERKAVLYTNNRIFHHDCFSQHGSEIPKLDLDLLRESGMARITLVQLKNLKSRNDMSRKSTKTKSNPKKKSSKRKTATKKKTRGSAPKRRNVKKKSKSRTKRRSAPKRRKVKRRVKARRAKSKTSRRVKRKKSRRRR